MSSNRMLIGLRLIKLRKVMKSNNLIKLNSTNKMRIVRSPHSRMLKYFLVLTTSGLTSGSKRCKSRWNTVDSEYRNRLILREKMIARSQLTWFTMRLLKVHRGTKMKSACLSLRPYLIRTKTRKSLHRGRKS